MPTNSRRAVLVRASCIIEFDMFSPANIDCACENDENSRMQNTQKIDPVGGLLFKSIESIEVFFIL